MKRYAARAVIVAGVLLAGVSGAIAAGDGVQPGLSGETFAATSIDADSVVLGVRLHENGTATWQVSYRVELTTDNETAAFESLRADIEANSSTYVSAFRDRMERTARTAENATGRQMSIEGVTVSTATEGLQNAGEVTYRFRWTNFATVEGEAIRAGDALAGFFLEENSRLRMAWPDGYESRSVTPDPDDEREHSVSWNGPVEFGADGPSIEVTSSSGPSLFVIGAAAVVAVGLALGAFLFLNREELPVGDDETADDQTVATDESVPDEELLSNEERVLRLLEERGGRVKQQAVATEFEWTDAKTSQVVKTLREDDRVDVFRLGRENVLVLPEESDL